MEFPELDKSLDSWAHFVDDSPVARTIRKRFEKDMGAAYKKELNSALLADLACFMSAVYQGGVNAGRVTGAEEYARTQPKPPQAIRVHGAWETVDEYSRHGEQIGWFSTDVDATIAAQKRGWYGGEGSVVGYDAIRYDGVIYILRDRIDVEDMDKDLPKLREQKIAEAKAKLTPAELKLLGLKP